MDANVLHGGSDIDPHRLGTFKEKDATINLWMLGHVPILEGVGMFPEELPHSVLPVNATLKLTLAPRRMHRLHPLNVLSEWELSPEEPDGELCVDDLRV